jgi:hypothetical protein
MARNAGEEAHAQRQLAVLRLAEDQGRLTATRAAASA